MFTYAELTLQTKTHGLKYKMKGMSSRLSEFLFRKKVITISQFIKRIQGGTQGDSMKNLKAGSF